MIEQLQSCKQQLNLFKEVKWQKVTSNYLEKYVALMKVFFDLVREDRIKVRIMFTQNRLVPTGLSNDQRRLAYYLLYYQFLKHAFGLPFCNPDRNPTDLRINLDQLPANREANSTFKSFILRLNHNAQFRAARLRFREDQIAEVRSHDHVLLQCLDVVLGAMCFRLNDKHLEKPPGQANRGNRTIAKEKLYRYIQSRVRGIYSNFNIGDSTGIQGDPANRWNHPYRHWKFIPKDHEVDRTKSKPK